MSLKYLAEDPPPLPTQNAQDFLCICGKRYHWSITPVHTCEEANLLSAHRSRLNVNLKKIKSEQTNGIVVSVRS